MFSKSFDMTTQVTQPSPPNEWYLKGKYPTIHQAEEYARSGYQFTAGGEDFENIC